MTKMVLNCLTFLHYYVGHAIILDTRCYSDKYYQNQINKKIVNLFFISVQFIDFLYNNCLPAQGQATDQSKVLSFREKINRYN